MVSKKRRESATLFAAARELAESTLRDTDEAAERVNRLSAGLVALWPAPLTAALLTGPDGEACAARDEAGHVRPDWHEAVCPLLAAWADGPASAAAPAALGLRDHVLHGAAAAWGGRRYGAVALALHKRTADAALAQTLLTHLADHLGFRLSRQEAERQAEARYRDLADLTNLVGHEFNNVLNSVGLQVAALAQRGLTPDHFTELAEVRKGIGAAGLLVRRLQDLCYKGSPPRRPADVNRAVRTALAADPGLAGRVRFEPAPDLPPAQGAPSDLARLAAALLRGAGPGAVALRTGRGPDSSVWLRVEDAGPDPDDELLPRLFEPFVAVRAGDDGVALALAKAIARRLGGNVRGEKRAGGGMAFVAELRAAEEGAA
jgi:signal transduction histidine kinase